MKFIIIAVVIISIIIESKSQSDEATTKRLRHTFKKILQIKNHKQALNASSIECIKTLFKLPQNEKMIFKQLEERIFMIAADIKCLNEERTLKGFLSNLGHEYMNVNLKCMIWHLQKIEPTSKLVKNVDFSEDELAECKEIFENPYKDDALLYEKIVGPLDVFSCGAVSGFDDFIKLVTKYTLATFGEYSDELKNNEIEKLKEYLKNITFTTVNCIIKRFEDDPAGKWEI